MLLLCPGKHGKRLKESYYRFALHRQASVRKLTVSNRASRGVCLLPRLRLISRPFNAHNQLALAMKINTEKVAPIPSRYSPSLFATIEWMLNKVVSWISRD